MAESFAASSDWRSLRGIIRWYGGHWRSAARYTTHGGAGDATSHSALWGMPTRRSPRITNSSDCSGRASFRSTAGSADDRARGRGRAGRHHHLLLRLQAQTRRLMSRSMPAELPKSGRGTHDWRLNFPRRRTRGARLPRRQSAIESGRQAWRKCALHGVSAVRFATRD